MVRWTDRPTMTIAVDLGRKATKQTNKLHLRICHKYQNLMNWLFSRDMAQLQCYLGMLRPSTKGVLGVV